MERLRLQAARIAPHFRIALITGEPGTGKKRLGLELHRLSTTPDSTFLVRPATDFAEDRSAASPAELSIGTFFLCGVESLSLLQQDQLLERLQHARFSGLRRTPETRATLERVVLGSQFDLRGLVAAGRMRPEFLARIGTIELRIPPLRERPEDLEHIATDMFTQMQAAGSLGPSALETLRQHTWPGNLRELRQVLEDIRNRTGLLEAGDLPGFNTSQVDAAPTRLDDVMQRHVIDMLQRCAGNKLRAAELLGISRSTLYRMLESIAA